MSIVNFLVKSNLKSHLIRYKSALTFSFLIGLFVGSLPFIYKSKENFRIQKSIEEAKKIQTQNQEKICKEDGSDFQKFLNLGFPKTANEKFNICMREK